MSVQNILIDGTALFQDNTENAGVVETGLFDGSAVNTGTTTTATFSGTAANHGTVVEEATFSDSAVNTGTVAVAAFVGSASNAGTITQEASFADTTTNSGVVSGTATFSGSAENDGGTVAGAAVFADTATNTGIISGAVVFSGDAVNNGTVAEAIFLGNAQNGGTVTLSATFAENAGNLATGLIQGDAVFAGNTVNAGTIQGNAEIAATANGEQGTVAGSVTTYTQPDGAFAFGYYSGGVKAAAPGYATVVYQAGIFWYKYDASGNGALATGNYSDGTSWFTFTNGVKGAAYNAPGNWYDDDSASAVVLTVNGTVSQSDEGSGVFAASFNGGGGTLTGTGFDVSNQTATIEFFAKLNQNADGSVLNLGTPSSPSGFHLAFSSSGHFVLSDGATYNTNTCKYAVGKWAHYAVVITPSNIAVYKNGTHFGDYANGINAGATNFSIGNYFGAATSPLNGKVAGMRLIIGTELYTSNFAVPTALLTAVTGTELLLNFGATDVPTVYTFTGWNADDSVYYIDGESTNLDSTGDTVIDSSGNYSSYNGIVYNGGNPYTGSAYYNNDEYGNPTMRIDFVNGVEVYNGPNV